MQLLTFLSVIFLTTNAMPAASQAYKLAPSSFTTTRCGNKLGTPTYGDKGIVFTVCAERELNAPIEKVYDALLDFSRYPNWNSFVVNVTTQDKSLPPPGPVPNGFEMTFTTAGLIPKVNTTSNEIVTLTEKDVIGDGSGKVMMNGWRYDGFGQQAEHPNLLVDLGGGKTRYVSWESYYGLVAPVTGFLRSSLKKQFEKQADDLKRLVES